MKYKAYITLSHFQYFNKKIQCNNKMYIRVGYITEKLNRFFRCSQKCDDLIII